MSAREPAPRPDPPLSHADPRLVGNAEGNQKLIREDRDAIQKHLTDEREEPLHERMRRAAYSLVGVPRPDEPLTDDQTADVIAAAHLMMRAAYRLEDAEADRARRKTTSARVEQVVVGAWIAAASLYMVIGVVGILLDATH